MARPGEGGEAPPGDATRSSGGKSPAPQPAPPIALARRERTLEPQALQLPGPRPAPLRRPTAGATGYSPSFRLDHSGTIPMPHTKLRPSRSGLPAVFAGTAARSAPAPGEPPDGRAA